MKIQVINQSDAAYMIRRTLGPIRAWEDLLSDMRQGKNTFHGLVLLPCGTDRSRRPTYYIGDIREFLRDAIAIEKPQPNAATSLASTGFVEFDPTSNRLLWRTRVLKPTAAYRPFDRHFRTPNLAPGSCASTFH